MEGASDRAANRRLRQILQVTRRSDQESTLEGSIGLVSSPVYAVQQHITPPHVSFCLEIAKPFASCH